MADKLTRMPLDGNRFYGDEAVKVMGDSEEAWYLRLLWHQWEHGSIPTDERLCWKVARPEFGTQAKKWDRFYQAFIIGNGSTKSLFPPLDEYRGQNSTLEEIRAEVLAAAEARTEKAKLAASARWAKTQAIVEQNSSRAQAKQEHS